MYYFTFGSSQPAFQRVLCLGAHSDDIEIGCGGTILRLIQEYPNLYFHWVVFSASEARAAEAMSSAKAFLQGALEYKVVVKDFRDGYFPYIGADIKDYFEELKKINPTLVLTHFREDLHQDHRTICELTWNTFRDHLILEYEIPKYDGGLGSPNFFVPLSRELCENKITLLLQHFQTQTNKHWFTRQTLESLLAIRGIESRTSSQLAEGFYARKAILHP